MLNSKLIRGNSEPNFGLNSRRVPKYFRDLKKFDKYESTCLQKSQSSIQYLDRLRNVERYNAQISIFQHGIHQFVF